MATRKGLCECGCGGVTAIVQFSDLKRGCVKGEHNRFIHGHHSRGKMGDKCSSWKGGRFINSEGYVLIRFSHHPRTANNYNYVFEHILVAEKALGKHLPAGAVIHHINGNKADNRPDNLVICPDRAYHALIHQRQRAMEACGNPDARKCKFCKEYEVGLHDDNHRHTYHQKCKNEYQRNKRQQNRRRDV